MTYTFAFKKVDTWIHVYKKLSFWLYFLVGYRGNVTAWNIFNGLYEMRTQICFLGFSSPLRLSSQYTDSVKKSGRGQSIRNFSLNCFLQAGSSLSAGDLQGWHILRRRWLCVRMTGRKLPTPPPAWLGWNSQVCRRQSVLSQPWWGRCCRISSTFKIRIQKKDWLKFSRFCRNHIPSLSFRLGPRLQRNWEKQTWLSKWVMWVLTISRTLWLFRIVWE